MPSRAINAASSDRAWKFTVKEGRPRLRAAIAEAQAFTPKAPWAVAEKPSMAINDATADTEATADRLRLTEAFSAACSATMAPGRRRSMPSTACTPTRMPIRLPSGNNIDNRPHRLGMPSIKPMPFIEWMLADRPAFKLAIAFSDSGSARLTPSAAFIDATRPAISARLAVRPACAVALADSCADSASGLPRFSAALMFITSCSGKTGIRPVRSGMVGNETIRLPKCSEQMQAMG